MMRERDVEKYLREQVVASGGLCWKWVSPGTDGVPDRIVVRRIGVLVPHFRLSFVEIKAPGNSPTRLQAERITTLQEHGQDAGWLDSYEAVDRFMSCGDLNEV